MLTIYKSLIRPLLEYNCEIWNPYRLKDIIELEKIQRAFTFRIFGMQNFNYWERLDKLKLLSLQRRREKIIILNIWKIKNNLIPNSINLMFKDHARSQACKAVLPPLPKIKGNLLTKYENSFALKGAKLWNALPSPLTRMSQISEFRSSLDKHLRSIPDRPPLHGYQNTNHHSLTELRPPGG